MQLAIIDLGTNTFNLLVVKVEANQKFKTLYNDKIAVKLGEGGINQNTILPIPFERGLNAFKKHLDTCKQFELDSIEAFATSAIRSSSNGKDFVAEIKKRFGIAVQVIDGDREAELIYEGVNLGVKLSEENSLIMDIGGGSTEFIIANASGLIWKKSFDLGAARLLEKFKPTDPILPDEVSAIELYLAEHLQSLSTAIERFGVLELIGSSGSFDTFAEVISHQFYTPVNLKEQSSFEYNLDDFYKVYMQLLKSTKAERLITPGIIEMRADMIVISGIFTNFILQKFKLKKMRLSTYALKEGVIAQRMNSL